MSSTKITTVETLEKYLQHALMLEHATIPAYLTALFSIHPGTNSDAYHILRVVVVEEMLHLTLAANLMNSVGGVPDLAPATFVPLYPACLPDGERDFQVDLRSFSPEALEIFLKIERPGEEAPHEDRRTVARRDFLGGTRLGISPGEPEMQFWSIGEFYAEIERGFDYLYEQMGPKLFCGDPKRQVTSEHYYSGGGNLFPVTDIDSARAAIDLIIRQGEGVRDGIYERGNELDHYHRFQQLDNSLRRYYQPGDVRDHPTGPELRIDWDAVYPLKTNARLSEFKSPELHAAALDFNRNYAEFLGLISSAYNGEPQLLLKAVPWMFRLRNAINQLTRNPLPDGSGLYAAPTFEMAALAQEATA